MELLDRLGQKIGETVGIYSRTADEDENFVRQEKLADATRDATEQLLKTLTPESTTYLNSRTLASLRTQKEEKDGEKLLQIGEAMQQADQYTSLFGLAVSKLGETMKRVGTEHSELDNRLMISTIDPLKGYNAGQLQELLNLKKRYDSNRLDYDAARRNHESKKTRETEEKMDRARQKFEESRTAYYNRLIHSQDDENEHVAQLQAYAAAQAIYYRRCADLYDSLTRDLTAVTAQTPDRPRVAPQTLTYTDHSPTYAALPPATTVPAITAGPGPVQQSYPVQQPRPAYGAPGGQQPATAMVASAAARPGPSFRAGTPGGQPVPMGGGGGGGGRGGPAAARPVSQAGRGAAHGGTAGRGALPVHGGAAGVERCRALYSFQAERPTELSLREGDVVVVKSKVGEWWEGEVNGRKGFFPASYVQPL